MDPNDQNQQTMGGGQPQSVSGGQQMSEHEMQGMQGVQDQPVAGPQPMPEAPQQEAVGTTAPVNPPAGDVNPTVPPEQVNPVEPASQYGVGQGQSPVEGQVTENTQSDGGGNPPQGI